MLRSLLLIGLLPWLLTACLTDLFTEKSTYKPQREAGQSVEDTEGDAGYKTVIAGDDRYNVEFTVKKKNDLRDAAIWGLYRCAELAKQEDAGYLVFQRGRIEGEGYSYTLTGNRPYQPEIKPPFGVKGGVATFLFKVFKDKASAEAFKNDPSVTHRVVYETDALIKRLSKFQKPAVPHS